MEQLTELRGSGTEYAPSAGWRRNMRCRMISNCFPNADLTGNQKPEKDVEL